MRCRVRRTGRALVPTGTLVGVLVSMLMSALLAACSPALNWRTVSIDHLQATLPCKPDQAERTVTLGRQDLSLQMLGCEADGALFAISRVDVGHQDTSPPGTPVPGLVIPALAAWKASALHALQTEAGQALPFTPPPGASAMGESALRLQVEGRRPQGGPVQAQLAWLVVGNTVYHLAVYADRLTPEMTEPFFTGLKLP